MLKNKTVKTLLTQDTKRTWGSNLIPDKDFFFKLCVMGNCKRDMERE